MSKLFNDLKGKPFLIAGPCVIESNDICFTIAKKVKEIAERYGFTYIFKASFDKANRSSISSYRGVSIDEANNLYKEIKKEFNLPILTDIHECSHAEKLIDADILQIPAFLARQTDLLLSAANTGKIVNIKKAQFMSGDDMQYPIEKVLSTGNEQVLLTERGTMFGYNNLVVDFRNMIDMQQYNLPIVFDVTHSTQRPSALNGVSGGDPHYVPYLSKAAAAIGVRGFFLETHPEPDKALSDGNSMVKLDEVEGVIAGIREHIK